MTVRFRATLASGEKVFGPIQACGGLLGNGALHAGYERAARAALDHIEAAQRASAEGRQHSVWEPQPGHVAVFPDYSAFDRGAYVLVPLAGTVFEVLSQPESTAIARANNEAWRARS